MVEVPTTDDVKDSGMSGVTGGIPAGAGALVGKSILGPGIGTAAGGIAGASFTNGNTRVRTAETAVILGLAELGGGLGGSGGSSDSRGRM